MAKKRNPGAPDAPTVGLFGGLLDEKTRPVYLKYLLLLLSALFSVLFFCLPMVKFRTVGGESDAHSLLYWMKATFFGVDGTKGAYESLLNASSGNQSIGFYRAVIATCIVLTVLMAVGVLATLLSALLGGYLLSTEEKTEQAKKLGSIYRVLLGNRYGTLVPVAVTALPFLYSHLLAYYYTALLSNQTDASFAPFDPLIVAIGLLLLNAVLHLYSANAEKRMKYDIFRSHAKRVTREDLLRIEREAWEREVRADRDRAEERPIAPKRKREQTETPPEKKPERAERSAEREDETLFGREFVVGKKGSGEVTARPNPSARPAEEETKDENEMRSALQRLFDDGDENAK